MASAAELPADTEAVVVFVVNAAQTEDVLFGAQGCLAKLAKGAVILCCATIAPEAARALEPKIAAAGFLMLDAPVSGGKAGAQAGTMTVMASGIGGGVRQGTAGAGCDLHQGLAAWGTGRASAAR